MNTDPGYEARLQVSRAVNAMTANLGDPRSAAHDPLAALAALAALRAALAQAEREAARRAREDGLTWAQIAVPLGVAGESYGMADSPASRAYSCVMPGYRGISPYWFTWTCPACGENIRDYGPGLPPDEAEKGHARTCPRFAATVAAWDATWEDNSGERDA